MTIYYLCVEGIMRLEGHLGLSTLVKTFPYRICLTWAGVLAENFLMALIPLLIGFAIDGLLQGAFDHVIVMGGVLVGLTVIAVARRIYDTRAYGTIRLHLGAELDQRHQTKPVSKRAARLNMSRELVDYLEEEVPEVLSAVIQIIVALVVLAGFHLWLSTSAFTVVVLMLLTYSAFNSRFYLLNSALNAETENQVHVLERGSRRGVWRHLRALRMHEVRLSDTEAIVYGVIFLFQIAFIVSNLILAAGLPDMSTGMIFSIVAYSWEFVEAAIMLPMTMQSLTRLNEITARINNVEEE
ncbi:ABC transporter six-transmembrane domain-containing protein [Pseudovibrio sp. Ad26]|uniref:ABC transporter six-transmembrane domain-containing protein n=2 Tax=unclassified Pseudovibrio TaxID=2627060 RepID=UPI0009ED36DC|nr:ABC transporter six-transmembrane domain-containing protein [Pseudovibrio sp. Ad26]